MELKLSNFLTKKTFSLKKNKKVNIYCCGPTVYNYLHLGNARPLLIMDILSRTLKAQKIKFKYVMNITDIDDKIIDKAKSLGKSEKEISDFYSEAFINNIHDLNINKPNKIIKISALMKAQIKYIKKLINKKSAYLTSEDVYFDTSIFLENSNRKKLYYGELSKKNINELKFGERVELNNKKHNGSDFVLWKKTKEGINFQSPWGLGRPGWHTECAVVNSIFFKKQTIDIHGGGIDLSFPHHENERIQHIAIYNKELSHCWLYNGLINLNNKKMSKSTNNILFIKDFLKNHSVNVMKYIFFNSKYSNPLNISDEVILEAYKKINRIESLHNQLLKFKKTKQKYAKNKDKQDYRKEAIQQLNKNLNTANCLSVLDSLIKKINILFKNNQLSKEIVKDFYFITKDLLGFVF